MIVPVKQTAQAKSRLIGLAPDHRRELALAFALDTVNAALSATGVRRVVVVTNDPEAVEFERLGAEVLPDRPDAGLNPGVRARSPSRRQNRSVERTGGPGR